MNNNSKRKNRPSGVSRFTTDNRQPKGRTTAQGVYNNTHFMHAGTALVGNVVQVRLRSGNIYEGVFRTFSQNFDVALELPFCIKTSKNAPDEGKSVPNYMIFPYDNVVSISAKDFDSQYATVGTSFQTDAAISEKCNGTRSDEKELEPWDPSGMNGDVDIELDGAANGWDPNEMFEKNKNSFGVQSTFDDSLSDYTVQLDKKDSDEFKEAEMKAEKLAAEIENNPACRERLDLENGDEEAMFAAVERPSAEVERERERERERDRERERERERGEREREKERERERERCERERERERERDREREREREREVREVPERYITKPQRSITGPPPPVAMASSTMSAASSGPSPHVQREREINERPERVMNAAPPPVAMGQTNSTQSSAPIGGMKGSVPQSANMGQDNKYASVMKRKPMSQNNKMVRNTPPPNSGGGSGGGGGGAISQGGGGGGGNNGGGNPINSSSGGSQHNVKSNSYQSMPMQNQPSYVNNQNYTPMSHGPSQYRHQSNMGGGSKQNGDSNVGSGKPMPQRNIRQYQGAQSNSSLNYGEPQHQMQMGKTMHVQHGPPHGPPPNNAGGNNSSSPPLQTGGGGGPHGPHSQPSGNMHGGSGISGPPSQPPPQPQRLMRNRDNQLQDLRQFGQDFQLAGGNAPPSQQQQQQQQAPQPQQTQHIQLGKNAGGHNPQPAVSPPQQQQQHIPQQQQHVAMQHVSPPQQQQQQHVPQHHAPAQHQQQPTHSHQAPPPQQHYVAQQVVVQQVQQHVPPHVQQQQQQQQQQKQHQHVDSSNMMHIQKVQPPPPHVVPQQQQPQLQQHPQQQLEPPPQQTLYHSTAMVAPPTQQQQQQTSPVVISSPPIENTQQNPIQQQQTVVIATNSNVQNNNKPTIVDSATSVASNNNAANAGSIASADKSTPPTAVVKKTHVLNPSAKPFKPRSPSTPNPSRPHTPQTPVPMTGIYTTSSHVAANQTQIYAVMQQPTAFQAPIHPQAGQQPRLRRSNYGPMTASQMHVSATTATGQPLLAAAPIPQFIHYQQTTHPTHFQSQPYTSMPFQLLAQTPPSTTPSPGQPHQAFHPPPQPSPAGGGPQPTYAPQTQPPAYHLMCPVIHPSQLVQNHHYYQAQQHPQQSQQFQIVMQQHPNQ